MFREDIRIGFEHVSVKLMEKCQSKKIAHQRLMSQKLYPPFWRRAEQVVGWLGGVQAQFYDWGIWSFGLRMKNGIKEEITNALKNRQIIRTWVFRGTLHFVAPSDVFWLNPLLAPIIISANSRRYRQLELDEAVFEKSGAVIRHTLGRGRSLTRSEIARSLEEEGDLSRGAANALPSATRRS